MNAIHPDDQTLKAYGLGKLDDGSASTINDHLETCPDCRDRVSGFTSDSFLGRFRDGHQPSAQSVLGGSLVDGTVSFMQGRAASPPPPTDTLPPGLADHPDYEIKRELGRGGMGVVYLAHNTMMGRDEVLKVMGRHIMERPGVLERFQREIRAVAKLRHPNIVVAHSAFRIEGGLVFAMEHVEGLDLSRLVKAKGELSVAHAAYFVHQAALGLQHAHEKGLIHRDIKPQNLMLTHDGKARLVKVLDFGLAKATREEKVDVGLTSEGQALGTPDYIAPEQIVNALDVDIRADLYSLGGTLYYLLTGRPPFQCTSLYDIYQAHMSRDADPLNLIRPEVPAELATLVAKMMAKEPSRRFQTPGEVAQALTPFFKKAASDSKGDLHASRPVATPIEPRPATRRTQASKPEAAPAPLHSESLWEGLFDAGEADRSEVQLRPILRTAPRGRPGTPRWLLPAMAVGLTVVVSLVALWFSLGPSPKVAEGVHHEPSARKTEAAPPIDPTPQPAVEEHPSPSPAPPVVAVVEPAPPAIPKPEKPEKTPRPLLAKLSTQQELITALEMRVPMRFPRGTSLGDLVMHIRKATKGANYAGIPVFVDALGLQEAEKSMASVLTVDVQGRPLKQTLRLALRELGLDYRTSEGLLNISSAGGDPNEGPAARIEVKADRNADSKRVLVALEQPIPMRYPDKARLGEVVDAIRAALQDTSGSPVPIHVSQDGLNEANKSLNSEVTIDVEGVPLRITLHWLLHQIGMNYYVKDGVLTITDWSSIPQEF
jgi:serine/threonine protein kinase